MLNRILFDDYFLIRTSLKLYDNQGGSSTLQVYQFLAYVILQVNFKNAIQGGENEFAGIIGGIKTSFTVKSLREWACAGVIA
jgi:hypothetical protein